MKNPLRSEAEAYRFLLLTVGFFAAIVIATAIGGHWVGLAVFIALSVVALVFLLRRGPHQPPRQTAPAPRRAEDVRRILVIANETVGGRTLREEIRARAQGFQEEVLVVSPALNSPLRHWTSDEDEARAAAHARLNQSLSRLEDAGIRAFGEVGDGDPLQAIEDALRTFGPDEVIISTHPPGRSNWLERGVVEGARERFAVPITHVVVDLSAEQGEVR